MLAPASEPERRRFNLDDGVAGALAAEVLPGCRPASPRASERFGWYETDQALVIVSGIQEETAAELALAYGLTLRKGRRLLLVLPEAYSLSTLQRVPFLKPEARPSVWLHDVPRGGTWPDPSRRLWSAAERTREEAVEVLREAVRAGLGAGGSTEQDLGSAMSPLSLGVIPQSVRELIDWATAHPKLDPAHVQAERAWHCAGQKVLTVRRSRGGLVLRAGIQHKKPGMQPVPIEVPAAGTLTGTQIDALKQQVKVGIARRLRWGGAQHKPDEHWLQAVIRRTPELVGVEMALREVPAWRPRGAEGTARQWGRGFVDLVGLDGSGDLRLVETKLAKNKDDMLVLQGLDYYVWAQAYGDALRARLGAAADANIVVHYVVGAVPLTDQVHLSRYAAAQIDALDIPWRFQLVHDWFAPPQDRAGEAWSYALPAGALPCGGRSSDSTRGPLVLPSPRVSSDVSSTTRTGSSRG